MPRLKIDIGFGFMGAAAVWCSPPAAFSLARAEIVFLVSTRTERRRIIRLAFVLAMGAASFLLLYFVSLSLSRCARLRKIAPSLISGASIPPHRDSLTRSDG